MLVQQYDGHPESRDELLYLTQKLAHSPLIDERGRKLYIRVSREGIFKNDRERKRLYAICRDLSKAIVLSCDPAVGFQHVKDASDPPGWFWFTDRQFVHMFTAVATGEKAVPHPDPDSRAQILLGVSVNDCTRDEMLFAVESAIALGNRLDIAWTPPKNQGGE